MLDTLLEQKRALEVKLAEARAQRNEAAYRAATGAAPAARNTPLAGQVEKLEAEVATLDGAIHHAELLAADERRAADEQAKANAVEQRRRSLERAINSFESSVTLAAEMDKHIEALGTTYQRWREQFDQSKGMLATLLDRPTAGALASIGVRNLRDEILDRLASVDVINDHTLTTADRARTVAQAAEYITRRWLAAAQAELQHNTETESEVSQ